MADEQDQTTSGSGTQQRKRIPRRCLYLLIAVMAMSVGLRCWRLGGKSFWLDEATSVYLARLQMVSDAERGRLGVFGRMGRMITELKKHDAHPPLFQIALFVSVELSGGSESAARLPSAVAGVAAVLLMYGVGARLFDRRTGLIAAAMAAVSAHLVYFSQEARLHGLVVLITVAHLYLLARLLLAKKDVRWVWPAYVAVGAAGLWTYAPYGTVLVGHWAMFALYGSRRRLDLDKFIIAQILILASILPWIPAMREVSGRVAEQLEAHPEERVPFTCDRVGRELSGVLGGIRYMHGLSYGSRAFFPAALVLVYMMKFSGAAIIAGGLRKGTHGVRLYALVFLPVLAYCLAPIPRVHVFELKHVIFFVPLGILAAAAWVGDLSRLKWVKFSLGVLLILGNLFFALVYLSPRFEKEPWRQAIAGIESKSRDGDLLMVNPEYAQAPCYVYGTHGLPMVGPPVPFGRRMSRELSPAIRRVWLVDVRNPVARPALGPGTWLDANWRSMILPRVTTDYYGALGSIKVRLFQRPGPSPQAPSPSPSTGR